MFTDMRQGGREDWKVIGAAHWRHQQTGAPMQIMDTLRRLEPMELGFAANQLTHSLMAATLARRDGASDEEVVAALCHDIGKVLSIPNHGPIAAEMLKPYVSDDIYQAIYWHQDFQGAYYYEYLGKPSDLRENFRKESWFAVAEKLVDRWDAPAFDPDFAVDPLESFEDQVVRVFSTPKR
ncbi:HD domain-containing protein [Phenylobacterium sp.]|jgi:predicted HD phosphohydrolase|uniref:HD domain-containing protein n=1 Tax=Phenylobacterium sp. TaxID=1871053 RepID=UPI003783F7B8